MLPNPTLDQLQVFLAVAESGSFSAAARALNRAQSVISYTIANLEAQVEMPLFERTGSRQPRLTEAGTAMLEDARRILSDLEIMRARVKGLKAGLEAEVAVAISVMVPADAMVDVLGEFREHFPSVSLRLDVGELGVVMDLVMSGRSTIGIGGAVLKQDDALVAERIGQSFMIPVAASHHALAKLGQPLTLADVREEVQLVVTDASGLTKGRDFNVLSYKTWRVSDVATKYYLIRGGLGWGGLPLSFVREDLRKRPYGAPRSRRLRAAGLPDLRHAQAGQPSGAGGRMDDRGVPVASGVVPDLGGLSDRGGCSRSCRKSRRRVTSWFPAATESRLLKATGGTCGSPRRRRRHPRS